MVLVWHTFATFSNERDHSSFSSLTCHLISLRSPASLFSFFLSSLPFLPTLSLPFLLHSLLFSVICPCYFLVSLFFLVTSLLFLISLSVSTPLSLSRLTFGKSVIFPIFLAECQTINHLIRRRKYSDFYSTRTVSTFFLRKREKINWTLAPFFVLKKIVWEWERERERERACVRVRARVRSW